MFGQAIISDSKSIAAGFKPLDVFKRHTGTAARTIEKTAAKSLEAPEQQTESKKAPKNFKKAATLALATVALAGLAVGGYQWYRYLTSFEGTDDAYVTGHLHPISARIDDTVQNVLVDDNDHVKAGQVLVVLDPRDYQVKVSQALASLSVAQHQAQAAKSSISLASTNATGKTTEANGDVANAAATIQKAQAAVVEAQTSVPAAEATLAMKKAEEWRANQDYTRYAQLASDGAVSVQQRDSAWRDLQVAQGATKAAEEDVRQSVARVQEAQHSVSVAQAQLQQSKGLVEQAKSLNVQTQVNASNYDVAAATIEQAQTALDNAKLQLSYTNIVSPINGKVGKKAVEAGQRVQPGQQLMDIVSDDPWVVANFKETQLEKMRPGQAVSIKIDSFPHHPFTGKLLSFAPGSGATFALLPPDNATGNFTKIVQRVPVKVVFDASSIKDYEQLIVPGMSAVVSVAVTH